MVYGYGSVGTRIAQRAVECGIDTVIAGRDPGKAAAAAGRLGLYWRSAPVTDRGGLDRLLDGVHVLVNTAGPFVSTSAPLIRACLRNRCHYVDVSNEIGTFRDAWSLESNAQAAGISLIPGAGFGTAATESLAMHVLARAGNPGSLTIVRSSSGTVPTLGVRKTTLSLLAQGGVRYKHGQAVEGVNGILTFDLPEGRRAAVPVASADAFAIAQSTGVPDIAVYFGTRMHPLLAKITIPAMRQLIRTGFFRPSARTRPCATAEDLNADPASAETRVWIQASNQQGETATSYLRGGRGAELTAAIAVEATQQVLARNPSGVLTSGALLGSRYALSLPGIDVTDL